MKIIYNIIIFLYYLYFLSFSKEEIILNPIKTNKESNEVDYIIIFKSETVEIQAEDENLSLNIKKNFVKYPHDSYLISQNLFVFITEINHNHLFLENRYYSFSFSSENEIYVPSISNKKNLISNISNIKFKDYIMSISYLGQTIRKDVMCRIESNEIIFYGKNGQNVLFYYKNEENIYSVYFGDIDEQISCKLLKEAIYVCTFSENSQIKIKFLVKVYSEDLNIESKTLKEIETKDIYNFTNHDNPIFYNTSNNNYKILCARKKDITKIECLAIEFDVTYSYNSPSIFSNIFHEIINEYQTSFSFNEDHCNFTKYDSEYLICCTNSNSIVCDRR